jgi:mannose-6-phosphate isomerase-like protein (cupin superfamily)
MIKLISSILFFFTLFFPAINFAQIIKVDTVKAGSEYENIYNTKLFSDSLSSSFIIYVKNEVKEHKHLEHSEHVIVLEGAALMTLADSSFKIKKDDVIFIPKNTFHSVKTTSSVPLKIISIQSPYFDGKDRVYK